MIDQNQILWDEKNLTELQSSCKNKNEQETSDITKDIKTSSTPNDWRNITDPKLRKKMYDKERYSLNKERIQSVNKNWHKKNRDKIRARRKEYHQENKDWLNEKSRNYQKANRDKLRLHLNKKRRTNTQFRLAHNLRARVRASLKDNIKSGSAVKNLGCSLEELKAHLESKFQPGMNWDNWSSNGWHIDHVKPLSSFDLSNKDELLKACHYTNLQPLWAKDNLVKGDKITF